MKPTRKEAIENKDYWYFTGKPCKYGHISKRYTVDGACYDCRLHHSREARTELRAAIKAG